MTTSEQYMGNKDPQTNEAQATALQALAVQLDGSRAQPAQVLLAGVDTLYFSCDITVSDAVRAKLEEEKQKAQVAAQTGVVHCPEWLAAQVKPQGAKGGYAYLIETEDFAVKILGAGIKNRPGIYIELRSHFLHTHPQGAPGACEEALCWVRGQLLYDREEVLVKEQACFKVAKPSRVDIHCDWQGGFAPSLASVAQELHSFIRPGKTKWGFYGQGFHPTGYTFGKGKVQARIYNKTRETREKANDAYSALLAARNGDAYDPTLDVWRLEFELKRDGIKGFRLYAEPDVDDDDAQIEAELSAEELEHIGTLPRLFARLNDLFQHLTRHWLRLVVNTGHANRSRWPLHPTWATLQAGFPAVAQVQPLKEDQRELVRGGRYSGKSRILRRLTLGVVSSLELEDASPASTALWVLGGWANRIAEREAERATQRCAQYCEKYGHLPRWVERGMGAHLQRAEQVRHRVQMLLGIFAARGVLPLEYKPVHSVGDLLVQHLDELEQEAEGNGGVQQVLADHFAKVYKVSLLHQACLGTGTRVA